MDVSVVEQVEVRCVSCGDAQALLRWLVVDLVARPELRRVLEDPGTYESTCEGCGSRAVRDTTLLVLGLADEAPLVLACPNERLGPGDFTVGSEAVIGQARSALRRERRAIPGPLLPVPFDVLAVAVTRDVDVDVDQPDAAGRYVEARAGSKTRERYERFLGYASGSRAQRGFEDAFARFLLASDTSELAALLSDAGPSFVGDARARCTAWREEAGAAGDDLGVGITTAQIALLDRCDSGDLAEGLRAYHETMGALADRVHTDEIQPLRLAVDMAQTPQEAVAACERLVAHARALANDQEEAGASVQLASLFWDRTDGNRVENIERACELLERALEIMARDPAARGSEIHLQALGSFGAALGARFKGDQLANQSRAIRVQRELLGLTSRRRNGRVWAMAQTNLGLALVEHATKAGDGADAEQIDEAVRHFKQALKWRSFERDPNDWAHTQINLALAYGRRHHPRRRRDLSRALRHVTEAIRGFEAAENTAAVSHALGNRSHVRVDLAQLADTAGTDNRKLLDAAEQDARAAITTIGEGVRGVHAGRRWWQLGQVLMAREQYTPHLVATIRRALEDLSPESAPYDCREAARRLGGMAANAGDWPVAAEAWEQAVFAAIAAVDARATPDGRFAEVVENLNICRWAAYALTRAGNPRRAIEVLELGRARELATWLRRDVVDLQEVRELDAQLCGRFLDLERRVAASARAGMAADDVAAAHIAEELSRTIEEIRQLSGLDSFLKPPSLEQTVSGMTIADSIAYPLTAQGAAWLILRKGVDGGPEIEVVDVPGVTSLTTLAALAPPGEAGDGVGGFLTALNSDDVDAIDIAIANAAPHLGPALLKPLADALAARGCTSVCVVPIGLLALVPLHALSWDDGGGQRCLLDEFDVKYAPSAYVHAVCRTRANRPPSFDKLLAVGNPMPQAQPLPGAEREARLVHAIVPAKQKVLLHGTAATKDAVLAALPAASHAHLACHGRAAMNDPRGFDAALWFAADSPASAAEILDLDLSQVRLIVTSACETAVVPSYAGADEALSLSSIFLGAGAAGVVASLWSVDDYATSFLMVRFYEELVASPANPAHALRCAQLWLRDLNAEEEARYASRHAALRVEHARRYAAHEPGRGRRAEQRSMPTWQTSRNPFARPSMWAAFAFCGV